VKYETRIGCRILARKHLGKWQLWRWEDNTELDVTKLGFEEERWIELAQDHVQWQTLLLA
jgi:hypothetical protein